jgi:Glutathione peroxidase
MIAQSTLALIIAALAVFTPPAPSVAAESFCPALLDHKFSNLMDEPVSLCQFSGKVLLIVNTASECGYTPQYDGLEKLYRRYREKGFVVLGFPANDFGGQEPRSNQEIAQFCRLNTASRSQCWRRPPSSEQTPIRYSGSLPPRPANRRVGTFISTCSTGRGSRSPHSRAPSSPTIRGLPRKSRNCSICALTQQEYSEAQVCADTSWFRPPVNDSERTSSEGQIST